MCMCVCDVNICFLSHDMWYNCNQFYVDIIVILYRHPLLHCQLIGMSHPRSEELCIQACMHILLNDFVCVSMYECGHDVLVCRM